MVRRETPRVALNGEVGKGHDAIDERLSAWMIAQPVFFIATAPLDPAGSVNCSPKGNRQEFAVIDDHTVAYLDQTGSGVETIAHLRENGRITVMLCAFEGPPKIVRFHGSGTVLLPGDAEFERLATLWGTTRLGARSIVLVDVARVSPGLLLRLLAPYGGHGD